MATQKEAKKQAPPRYSAQQRKAVVDDAKSGTPLKELIERHPMGKRAILRYLKKADVSLKK